MCWTPCMRLNLHKATALSTEPRRSVQVATQPVQGDDHKRRSEPIQPRPPQVSIGPVAHPNISP